MHEQHEADARDHDAGRRRESEERDARSALGAPDVESLFGN
jgi:hypothetical protein